MSIINDNINYLYNILWNDFNDSILNNTKNNHSSNISCNTFTSLLLDFHNDSFSVLNDQLKKNHLKKISISNN